MKRRLLAAFAAVLLLAPAAVRAGEAKPGGEASELVVVTATVEAINLDTREVTLKGADGKSETVKVGPEARNLPQVKVGDKVTIKYYQALAVFLGPQGEKPSLTTGTDLQRAPEGEKPGGQLTRVVEAKVLVDSVDAGKRTVTISGTDGKKTTLKVDPQVRLDQVKAGDSIVARYTEALAISVEKP